PPVSPLSLHDALPISGRVTIAAADLDRAADQLARVIDPVNGGMRGAPKFPQAMMLEFLWRAGERTGTARYCAAVELTLARICERSEEHTSELQSRGHL